MQGYFSGHISTLPDDSFAALIQYRLENRSAMLPNDVNLISMQGDFGKHMTTLSDDVFAI